MSQYLKSFNDIVRILGFAARAEASSEGVVINF